MSPRLVRIVAIVSLGVLPWLMGGATTALAEGLETASDSAEAAEATTEPVTEAAEATTEPATEAAEATTEPVTEAAEATAEAGSSAAATVKKATDTVKKTTAPVRSTVTTATETVKKTTRPVRSTVTTATDTVKKTTRPVRSTVTTATDTVKKTTRPVRSTATPAPGNSPLASRSGTRRTERARPGGASSSAGTEPSTAAQTGSKRTRSGPVSRSKTPSAAPSDLPRVAGIGEQIGATQVAGIRLTTDGSQSADAPLGLAAVLALTGAEIVSLLGLGLFGLTVGLALWRFGRTQSEGLLPVS